MNEFESKSGGGGTDDIGMLRLLMAAAIFLMCIVVCCEDMLMRQNTKDLAANVDMAQKSVEIYEKGDQLRASYFFARLNDYARTHPDFQPIMQTANRYLTVSTPPGAKK
jgi:hypothetical protein